MLQSAAITAEDANLSRELKTVGNKIVFADDESSEVRLVGVNPYAYNLIEEEELMDRSFAEAFDNWHCNVLRFPVTDNLWGEQAYKDLLVKYAAEAAKRGKYIIIDLHNFGYIKESDVEFWKEAAVMFKNNPAVLFGLLNEPNSITWKEWRDGGTATDDEGNTEKIYGHQELIEIIRDLGAKNIVVAGGLDWAYDLRGIAGEAEGDDTVYALVDQGSGGDTSKEGNGIIYDTHIYPWKGMKEWRAEGEKEDALSRAVRDWKELTSSARRQFPVLSGENGWDMVTIEVILSLTPGFEDKEVVDRVLAEQFQPGQSMYHDLWVRELFKYFNDTHDYDTPMNYTAWCFAPNSGPILIEDEADWGKPEYAYPPTEYWGAYVKTELKREAIKRGEIEGIIVTLNGKEVVFDVPPQNVDGRVLVPIRAVLEDLGATVDWDGASQTVIINTK